jgi:hypothetical protein
MGRASHSVHLVSVYLEGIHLVGVRLVGGFCDFEKILIGPAAPIGRRTSGYAALGLAHAAPHDSTKLHV